MARGRRVSSVFHKRKIIKITNMEITKEQIDELDRLQAAHNDGRGISCVRSILIYLREGDIESAITIRCTEGDKIRQYKDVKDFLREMFGCRLHNKHNCDEWLCKELGE